MNIEISNYTSSSNKISPQRYAKKNKGSANMFCYIWETLFCTRYIVIP